MQDRRYDVDVRNVDWLETSDEPAQPTLQIRCHGWRSEIEAQLAAPDGEPLAAEEIDVAFRFQSPTDDADATGVVSVADRVTGGFILEAATPATPIQTLVEAARRYGETTGREDWYGVHFVTDRSQMPAYEKRVFLVYAHDGTLLRHRSLIPNGIEI